MHRPFRLRGLIDQHRNGFYQRGLKFLGMLITGAIVAVNGLNPFSMLAVVMSGAIAMLPKLSSKNARNSARAEHPATANSTDDIPTPGDFKIYRQAELNRTTASLKANGAILIAGEDGSGKSVLAGAVVENLQSEGFMVAFIEPATPKQMLLEIAHQFDIPTEDLEGKSLTADKLKRAIATFLESNTAFLVLDDAHCCDAKFRMWLKQLRRSNAPMLLLATDPPRTDIFINIPKTSCKSFL